MGVFRHPLTSSFLYYLLQSDNNKKIVSEYLFDNYNILESDFKLEKVENEIGRFDLYIQNKDGSIFIIENKFNAKFTNSDQIKRYYSHINKFNFTNSRIIILTMERKNGYVASNILSQIGSYVNNIKIKYWENLIEYLESNNCNYKYLLSDFKEYLRLNYGLFITFNNKEIQLYNSQEYPMIIGKLMDAIDNTAEWFKNSGYICTKGTERQELYTRYIERDDIILMYGIFLPAWKKYSKPLCIEINQCNWERMGVIQNEIKKLGFVLWEGRDYGGYYFLPIEINTSESNIAMILKDIIQDLFDLLKTEHLTTAST